MDKKTFVTELVFLQDQIQTMREEGNTDLRGIIMHIENLIMAIESNPDIK